jgi:putative heme-binding domain-containing protein
MEKETSTKIPDWGHLISLNAKYGGTVKELLNNFPPANEIHYAFSLRNMKNGWTIDQRKRYFTFINKAAKGSGGASFPGFMTNIREEALALCSNKEREACKDITGENFNPVPTFEIKPVVGPGRKWTVESAMAELKPSFPKADFENGRSLYFATTCGKCHRFAGIGGDVGPDVTSIPNKFDMKYVLESIIEPSKNISDQYQAKVVITEAGKSYSGLVLEEGDSYVIYPSDTSKPADKVLKAEVLEIQPSKLSQMPEGLLDKLSKEELNDLMAYLMSGGNSEDRIYGKKKK